MKNESSVTNFLGSPDVVGQRMDGSKRAEKCHRNVERHLTQWTLNYLLQSWSNLVPGAGTWRALRLDWRRERPWARVRLRATLVPIPYPWSATFPQTLCFFFTDYVKVARPNGKEEHGSDIQAILGCVQLMEPATEWGKKLFFTQKHRNS